MAVRRHGAVIPAIVDGKLLEFRFADAPALAQTAVPIYPTNPKDIGLRP